MKQHDPQTPADWQMAADCAEASLLLDSARQYGLVTGGPQVNYGRCADILRRAARRGIRPTESGVQSVVAAIAAAKPRDWEVAQKDEKTN